VSALEAVRDSELFEGLSEDQRRRAGGLARERRAAAGEVLFRLGEQADVFYVVRKGQVDLTFPLQVMGKTKEARFRSLEPGRTLAWSALVPPHKLTMSARAATDVEMLAFDRQAVLDLFAAEPAMGLQVMSNLTRVVAARFHELLAMWGREVQRNVSQSYR
jgi:CRP-like cAMP-binding protein